MELFNYCLANYQDEIDEDKLAIHGGSHGGFLTLSIISNSTYRNTFKAALVRNPVTAINAMHSLTDMSDWAFSV